MGEQIEPNPLYIPGVTVQKHRCKIAQNDRLFGIDSWKGLTCPVNTRIGMNTDPQPANTSSMNLGNIAVHNGFNFCDSHRKMSEKNSFQSRICTACSKLLLSASLNFFQCAHLRLGDEARRKNTAMQTQKIFSVPIGPAMSEKVKLTSQSEEVGMGSVFVSHRIQTRCISQKCAFIS